MITAAIKTDSIFKELHQQQVLLLPPSLDSLIGTQDLVRVVNAHVYTVDLSYLLALYPRGGASSYHLRMLLKVMLYG